MAATMILLRSQHKLSHGAKACFGLTKLFLPNKCHANDSNHLTRGPPIHTSCAVPEQILELQSDPNDPDFRPS
jgi:hypothetical protein